MKPSSQDPLKTIPAPAVIVRYVLRHFATTPAIRAALLDGTDIDEERLKDPGSNVTLFTFITVTENLCRVIGEDWPLEAMQAWRPAMHGALEVAVRSAPTIGDSLEIVSRFGHVRGPYLTIRTRREKAKRRLIMSSGIVRNDTAWRALAIVVTVSAAELLSHLLEDAPGAIEFTYPWPSPSYAKRLQSLVPGQLHFDQSAVSIAVAEELCARPSPFADEGLLATAMAELERESHRIRGQDTLTLRVEHLLARRHAGRISEEMAANDLGLSRRTLVRRLADEGTSFRALLDAHLKQRARQLIDRGSLSRDKMSEALGFQDPTSFSRACKRWFGKD